MRTRFLFKLILLLLSLYSCSVGRAYQNARRSVSPYSFGLAEAKTDIDRYNVLYKTHQAAKTQGLNVDYSNISSITIEIPVNAKPIPLSLHTDFCKCTITITNKQKDCFLFDAVQKGTPIELSGKEIDEGRVSMKRHRLGNDSYLIVINDENPWVENRIGYRYGHTRKDILLLNNGKAVNSVVSPYNNSQSSPACTAVKVQKDPFVFKNLTVNRSKQSTAITNVVNVSGYNNIQISNITVNTPESKFRADRAITICNSTNVTLDHIIINGTYSQVEESGYGIYLDNIWNFQGHNIFGNGKWGVFGNNNLNVVTVSNSKINRFDVHCYGRDMSFKNVHFFNLYNQFASVFGSIIFEDCFFDNSIPLINGTSYNAYVGYDVYFKNCTMNATDGKNYIMKLGMNDGIVNKRKELGQQCWPNIHIDQFNVNLSDDIQHFYIITNKESNSAREIDYLSEIEVNGLTVHSDNSRFRGVWLSVLPLRTKKMIKCHISDVSWERLSETKTNTQSAKTLQIKVTGNRYLLN